MPITVNVVTEDEYATWLNDAKQKFALEDTNSNIKVVKNEIKKLN
jgi:heme/copper-type cytochrome/quinol oxidase subunit 2